MRISRDEWGLQLALVTARRGTCLRRQVGCVLVNHRGHVLATGYNGVASGVEHCNEEKLKPIFDTPTGECHGVGLETPIGMGSHFPHACPGARAPSGTNLDGCHAIHAEQNALMQCRDVHMIHTCYCTTSPCVTCVKLVMNTDCRRIVFADLYPHTEAEKMWTESGREWIQLKVSL